MALKLSLLTPEAVHAALAEFDRLGRAAFLERYGFAEAREYFVKDPLTGNLCDSKAIVGAAFGYLPDSNGPVAAATFSGGAATVQTTLERLGFQLVRFADKRESSGTPWSGDELALIVADYFDMLMLDLNGQSFNKSERRRRLMSHLDNRSDASIEFKRRNISAIVQDLGVPPVRGYLPARNVQRDLVSEVERQLRLRPELDEAARNAAERPCQLPDGLLFTGMLTPPPERSHQVEEPTSAYWESPIKRDYFEREARNRMIGRAGEELVVEFERWRLLERGLGQLADRVEHVSVTQGDGLGYDVLSFAADGSRKFVEVKTTASNQTTPFFVSSNEARFARAHRDAFSLYRVFDFRASPKIFELQGAIEQHCHLDPMSFRASFQ